MRAKALGLLQYGGLDESAANRLCDSVLAMPAGADPAPLFSDFITHALLWESAP